MNWMPDTCYCSIECQAPSKNGSFVKRCQIHSATRNTIDVYAHNLSNRKRGNETDEQGDTRKLAVREATRP